MTKIRGRRCKQLLDDCKEKGGYCKLKEEALDRTMWGTHCGRGCRKTGYSVGESETHVLCNSLACCVGNGLHHCGFHNMRHNCFPSNSFSQSERSETKFGA
jgi:hypothetical protein